MTPLQESEEGSYYERKYEEWYDSKCDFRPLPNRLAPVREIEELVDMSEFLPDSIDDFYDPIDITQMPFELMFDPASNEMTRYNLQTYYAVDPLYKHMPTIFLEDLIEEQIEEYFSADNINGEL